MKRTAPDDDQSSTLDLTPLWIESQGDLSSQASGREGRTLRLPPRRATTTTTTSQQHNIPTRLSWNKDSYSRGASPAASSRSGSGSSSTTTTTTSGHSNASARWRSLDSSSSSATHERHATRHIEANRTAGKGTDEIDPSAAASWPSHLQSLPEETYEEEEEGVEKDDEEQEPALDTEDEPQRAVVPFDRNNRGASREDERKFKDTVRVWHALTRDTELALDLDMVERMLLSHHVTYSTVCTTKKLIFGDSSNLAMSSSVVVPHATAAAARESQAHVVAVEQYLRHGCIALQANKVREAFELFDKAFASLKTALILQNLQGGPMLSRLVARFSDPMFTPLWTKMYRYISDLAAVLSRGSNPFSQTCDLILRSPIPLAETAGMILLCIHNVVTTQLGPMHPDTMDVRESLAWYLLDRGRANDALAHFTKLVTCRETVYGAFALETCEALRGLAESHIALAQPDTAEDIFEDILGRCRSFDAATATTGAAPTPAAPNATFLNVATLRAKCLLSLSLLAQQRQNWRRARWLLHQADQAARQTSGPGYETGSGSGRRTGRRGDYGSGDGGGGVVMDPEVQAGLELLELRSRVEASNAEIHAQETGRIPSRGREG